MSLRPPAGRRKGTPRSKEEAEARPGQQALCASYSSANWHLHCMWRVTGLTPRVSGWGREKCLPASVWGNFRRAEALTR